MHDTQLTTFANLHLWIKFQLKWIFSRQQWGSEDTAKVCSHKINQWSICAEQTRQQGEHISKWKKSEESWRCRALSSAASVCSWKDQSWQQDLLLDHLRDSKHCSLLGWVMKTCTVFSSHSPASNPQPSLTVYQIILLGDGHEGGDESPADI